MSFVSLYTSFVTEVLTIVKKVNIFEMTEEFLKGKKCQLKKAVIEVSASFVK